jgi:hypothetical protein
MNGGLSKEHGRELWQGRLALALVSARASECPNRRCGRKRHCLARFEPGKNIHDRIGTCPNMSEDEWRIVSLGMQRNVFGVLQPFEWARLEAEEAAKPKISWEEQKRRYWSKEEVEKRAEAARREERSPGWTYGKYLWLTPRNGKLEITTDMAGRGLKLIEAMAKLGCRCAKERKLACLAERGPFGRVQAAECI